jgi:hypothetical protein
VESLVSVPTGRFQRRWTLNADDCAPSVTFFWIVFGPEDRGGAGDNGFRGHRDIGRLIMVRKPSMITGKI